MFSSHSVGSSPRTWGKCLHRCRSGSRQAVHPHVRGANFSINPMSTFSGGSSPRTWGRYFAVVKHVGRNRFIPTYVGQMIFLKVVVYAPVRFIPTYVGQISTTLTNHADLVGSSPRTWGKLRVQGCAQVASRFIPTYVGQMRDHPRMPDL